MFLKVSVEITQILRHHPGKLLERYSWAGAKQVAIVLVISILMLLAAVGLLGWLIAGLFYPELLAFKKVRRGDGGDPVLKQRLLTLCGGDKALAKRLVSHARDYNRQRSVDWWYEKAIADLERDRYGR